MAIVSHSTLPPQSSDPARVEELISELLDAIGATNDRRLLAEIVSTAVGLGSDRAQTLDLKITSAALREMRTAFAHFAPYRQIPKVTVFGSARVLPEDPLYVQANAVAHALASSGWMVVTGAGPGIMAAAMEGAGRAMSFGVNIRLPFEQSANPIIAHDDKLVSMKYFFTRKLMLIKESKAFVCLPGGFGTLDEMFELLTLTQTGKGVPVPIVFIDVPGDPYWERVIEFMREQLVTRGLIQEADLGLFLVTDSSEVAVDEIERFYSNYDSLRFVNDQMVLRMKRSPDDAALAAINEQFAYLCRGGSIDRTVAHRQEIADDDVLELPRLRLDFDKRHWAGVRRLIDELNKL